MRQAVILAAGLGSRLSPSLGLPKPLVPVGGCPLLFWALHGAERAGCEEAVLVLGYCAEQIREFVQTHYTGPLRCRFAYNPAFERQNGLSLLAASASLERVFLLLMADHVVEAAALERMRTRPAPTQGALLLVDSRLERIVDLEDATKVQVRDGRVLEIGKALQRFNAIDTGIFVATMDLLDALEQIAAQHGDAALTDGVRVLAQRGILWAEELGDYFWQDVDTPETYAAAERWAQHGRAKMVGTFSPKFEPS